MKGFTDLYRAGRIARWHTSDVPAQSIASHSWGVAMIVLQISAGSSVRVDRVLAAALTHDMSELATGDVPALVKWANPLLVDVLTQIESKFDIDHDINWDLNPLEERVLKWADMFELCIYSKHQVRMGVESALGPLKAGKNFLRDLGFPTTEAKNLYHEYFSE